MSVTEPIVDSTTGNVILKPLAGIPLETLNSKANAAAISSSDKKETTTTATKAHTEGDYFELNGVFVKAIDDIAVGDTLTEGTNISSTNVGSELSRIDSQISSIPSYESKTAVSGGTAESLVTTGEKYTWNNKVGKLSGTIVDPESTSHTTVSVNSIGYDADNNQLILKTGGADTVVPFSKGGEITIVKDVRDISHTTSSKLYSSRGASANAYIPDPGAYYFVCLRDDRYHRITSYVIYDYDTGDKLSDNSVEIGGGSAGTTHWLSFHSINILMPIINRNIKLCNASNVQLNDSLYYACLLFAKK